MAPTPSDGLDLVRLEYYKSGFETELILGLLKTQGIPAVLVGQYDYASRNGHRGSVMVPRERLDEAYRLIREARGNPTGESSESPSDLRMPWWLRIAFATPVILLVWGLLQEQRVWLRILDWFH